MIEIWSLGHGPYAPAEQVAFNNKDFAAPRKCPPCVESTKAAKFVLYKAQLVAKKLANKKKKQALSTQRATTGMK